jgi:hypothetical protein
MNSILVDKETTTEECQLINEEGIKESKVTKL